jgi:predicted Zn-dependent protease
MRKLLLVLGTTTALLALTGPSFSMGGGGGGGMGGGSGGYGGSGDVGTTATYDDYQVAVRLIKHEKYADAIPHLNMALADHPQSADVLNYLGYTHRMVGDYSMSLTYYNRALAIDPNHKGVHEYLGELYLQMNDMKSAQDQLTTLASLCPSGCDERDMLTKAIAAYVPPAAPAATPAASGASSTAPTTTTGSTAQ